MKGEKIMGLDMGIVAAKKYEYLNDLDWQLDGADFEEILENKHFYDEDGCFQWPNLTEVWYARKFWDMINGVEELRNFVNERDGNGFLRITKEILKKMIQFYAFNPDYFDGFQGLPTLCKLYQEYDNLTAQEVKLYFYASY